MESGWRPRASSSRRRSRPRDRLQPPDDVDVRAGKTGLRIPEVPGEDMHLIAPLRVGRGYRLGMAYSVTDLRVLRNYAR